MALVYFVRDGKGAERTNNPKTVALSDIAEAFPNFCAAWSRTEPIISPECRVNPYSGFRHVVVRVHEGERAGGIVRDGFWLLKGISPVAFKQGLDRLQQRPIRQRLPEDGIEAAADA